MVGLSQARKPNIIYINTDDWGIGKVPTYRMDKASEKLLKTPNLDRLRAEGMLFTNAYAGNAVCGPSRCSLLTGRHPGNAAWRANSSRMPATVWPLKHPLLGEVARQAGYATAAFGKLSHGGSSKPQEITDTGWDYWLGFLGHIDCRDYYPPTIWENGKSIQLPANHEAHIHLKKEAKKYTILPKGSGVVGEGKGTFVEELYCEKAIKFIEKNQEQPFFIYFASTVPHGGHPGEMRVPSLLGYDDPSIRVTDKNGKVRALTKYERTYCALISHHDRSVGKLMSALKRLGIEKDTVIIWTSDNGDEDSYYKRTGIMQGSGELRKHKRYLYEGGIRVPMIAWWPSTITPGSVSDHQTAQWDLMATFADIGNQKKPEFMDGISIYPTLKGLPQQQEKHPYLYFEFYEMGKQQSVRKNDWKAYRSGGWEAPIELYDLSKDPAEQQDLAAQHPEIVSEMAAIMKKEHTLHPVWNLNTKTNKK